MIFRVDNNDDDAINDHSKLAVTAGVAFVLALMIGLAATTQASSGLKVYVYVHGAGAYVGQEGSVTVNTSQDYDQHREVIVPQADFYVVFQYRDGVVAVGDEIAGCANIYGTNMHGCASTWNSEDKKPERIDIYLKERGGR